MNAIVITSVIVATTLLLGVLIAVLVRAFSNMIERENSAYNAKNAGYQPAVSFGHNIPLEAELEDQIEEARKIAARQAARLPRGANVNIGQSGGDQQKTSFDGIDSDPVSAVRMAYFHGWAGLRTGAQQATVAVAPAKGVAEAVAPVKASGDLKPGVDYPYIEITEEMAPAEKRKARIANAKAKSAALKEAKAGALTTMVTESAPAVPSAAASPAPAAVGEVREPVAGVDYEVIAITDDMAPQEVRTARIANAKAKSAANKKFKAAGGGSVVPSPEVAATTEQPAEQTATQVDTQPSSANSVPSDIPAPNYIDITDDMDKDDVRKARIQNAKDKSAYNKALRAAGIDPKSV